MNPKSSKKTPIETVKERNRRFNQKQAWKSLPGNRYLPGEPTPFDDSKLVEHPQSNFKFDWA